MPMDLVLTLAAVFVSVAMVSASAIWLVWGWSSSARRQIRRLSRDRSRVGAAIRALSLTDAPSGLAKRLQQVVPKSHQDMSRLRRRLTTAGCRSASAAAVYAASEPVVAVAFGLLVVGVRGVWHGGWMFGLAGAAIGYMLPALWLARRTAQRQKLIQNGLPDALDLFIVCIEAGSSIDQAIIKSSDELEISHPALAEELRLVTTETRSGKPRLEAFKNFAARTRVDDVRALSAMLIQTDRFGTSIAQALRTHAETSRVQRRQRAEEKAGKIGVKLVFPLVFCLFPALYVAILGPAVVEYVRVFKHGLVR
jgi:tight adherence protein C